MECNEPSFASHLPFFIHRVPCISIVSTNRFSNFHLLLHTLACLLASLSAINFVFQETNGKLTEWNEKKWQLPTNRKKREKDSTIYFNIRVCRVGWKNCTDYGGNYWEKEKTRIGGSERLVFNLYSLCSRMLFGRNEHELLRYQRRVAH